MGFNSAFKGLIIYGDANASVFVKPRKACLLTDKPNPYFSERFVCYNIVPVTKI
jgi:hypothetical protein